MSGASSTWTRRLAVAAIATFAFLGAGSFAPAAGADPSPVTLRGPEHLAKEAMTACPAFERPCPTASPSPGPAAKLAERTSSRKPYSPPLPWENAKAKGLGGEEALSVTPVQTCLGIHVSADANGQ